MFQENQHRVLLNLEKKHVVIHFISLCSLRNSHVSAWADRALILHTGTPGQGKQTEDEVQIYKSNNFISISAFFLISHTLNYSGHHLVKAARGATKQPGEKTWQVSKPPRTVLRAISLALSQPLFNKSIELADGLADSRFTFRNSNSPSTNANALHRDSPVLALDGFGEDGQRLFFSSINISTAVSFCPRIM